MWVDHRISKLASQGFCQNRCSAENFEKCQYKSCLLGLEVLANLGRFQIVGTNWPVLKLGRQEPSSDGAVESVSNYSDEPHHAVIVDLRLANLKTDKLFLRLPCPESNLVVG